jgi:hypothetical protein
MQKTGIYTLPHCHVVVFLLELPALSFRFISKIIPDNVGNVSG